MRARLVIVLALLCSISQPVHAQNTVTISPMAPALDLTPNVYRGTSVIARDVSGMEACARFIEKDAATRAPGTYTYGCQPGRTSVTAVVKAPAPLPPPPPVSELPRVDLALVPQPRNGSGTRDIRVTGEMPQRDAGGIGAFRTVCTPSHFAFDDPLVYPGRPGASHLHVFLGNTGANGNSTPESIRTTGNSTCRGGIVNRSAYWVAATIDTRTGAPVVPDIQDTYYKANTYSGERNDRLVTFPTGFRMIAGDSKSRVAQRGVKFECNGAQSNTLPACSSGVLTQEIVFPTCWDGVNITSPDHKSHVAYPTAPNGCSDPRYPVVIPALTYRLHYNVPPGGTGSWRLSSDVNGAPAGSSMHGDFMFGWEEEVFSTAFSRIIKAGLSGGSHMVGDGRAIFGSR